MKNIITILLLFAVTYSFGQARVVPTQYSNGQFGKKLTINSVVAKTPLSITTGGGTDTIQCATCGSGAGNITGNGTAVRIPVWNSATRITSGLNLNADTTNLRIGFGTSVPTHTITFDSTRSRAGMTWYATTDQVTNYQRARIYNDATGNLVIQANEAAGSGACCKNIFLNGTTTAGAYITYVGGLVAPTVNSGTVTVTGTTLTPEVRWNDSRAQSGNNNSMRLNNFTTYNASSTHYTGVFLSGTVTQTGTAGYTALRIGPVPTTQGSGSYYLIEAGTNAASSNTTQTNKWTLDFNGKQTWDATNTAGGTTGAQTINKPSGTVNFAAAATSLVVTNSLVTTSSIVHAIVRTNDANKTRVYAVVPAAGSFTIYVDAAPAAEISVGFTVIN